MSVEVVVRHNVDVFLDVFQRVKKQSRHKGVRFRTWIDCKSGELCFAEERASPPTLEGREWKELHVKCLYDRDSHQMKLEEQDSSGIDLSPLALRVFSETIKAFKGLNDEEVPCSIKMVDYLLINQIWYPINRMRAESLLFHKPVGTYLFRKDFFTQILEDRLKAETGKKVSLWTLSVSGKKGKCSDYIVVHLSGKWQFYNDDPSLQEKKYSQLSRLIRSNKTIFRYPLYKS